MNASPALIFDLDGTLFRSETIVLPAFERTFQQLHQEGLRTADSPTESELLGCMGMLLEDIWYELLPDSSDEVKEYADKLFLQYELQELVQGGGELFTNVAATLKELRHQQFRLFVASNGLPEYVKAVLRNNELYHLFEGIYTAGEYKTQSKVELVARLLETHSIRSACMIGDRASDIEAGKMNGLFCIGCAYSGFGSVQELQEADMVIHSFEELLHARFVTL